MDAKRVFNNVLHWTWAESLLYWIIMSSATLSGLVLLVASIWISVNANEHSLMQSILGGGKIGEAVTVSLTQIAVSCFVGLPVVILIKVLVISLQHWQKYSYDPTLKSERFWAILYGIPALVFFLLDVVTLGFSAVSSSYIAWQPIVVLRAEMGYLFALVALAYHYLGEPQAVKQLQDRDDTIADLREELAQTVEDLHVKNSDYVANIQSNYQRVVEDLQQQLVGKDRELTALSQSKERELEFISRTKEQELEMIRQSSERETQRLSQSLEQATRDKDRLMSQVISSNEEALGAYSEVVEKWASQGIKSLKIDDIVVETGVDRRRINSAISKKTLRIAPNSEDKVLISTLVPWLKTLPTTGNTPNLHIVNE